MTFEKDNSDGLDFRLLTKGEIEELGGTPPGRRSSGNGSDKKQDDVNTNFVRAFASLSGMEQREIIDILKTEY